MIAKNCFVVLFAFASLRLSSETYAIHNDLYTENKFRPFKDADTQSKNYKVNDENCDQQLSLLKNALATREVWALKSATIY